MEGCCLDQLIKPFGWSDPYPLILAASNYHAAIRDHVAIRDEVHDREVTTQMKCGYSGSPSQPRLSQTP